MQSSRTFPFSQSSLDFYQTPCSKASGQLGLSGSKRRSDSLSSGLWDRYIPHRSLNETPDLVYGIRPELGDLRTASGRILDALFGISPLNFEKQRVLNFSGGSLVLEEKAKEERSLTHKISLQAKYSFSPAPAPCAFVPGRILAATNISANFYLQTVCWSSDDMVVFALQDVIYHVGSSNGSTVPMDDKYVCSVAVMNDHHIASGWNDGYIRVHSLEDRDDIPFSYAAHVGSVPMYSMTVIGKNTLVCGDKSGQLNWVDKRIGTGVRAHVAGSAAAITGLAYDGSFCVASGAEDKAVKLWDLRKFGPQPVHDYTVHNACIKAIAFQPGSGRYLVSGGGGTCGKVCVYDTTHRCVIDTIDTGSQISGLHWFTIDPRYLVTGHGYRDFSVKLWSLKSGKITLENNHPLHTGNQEDRVLCIAGSKESNQLVAVTQSEHARFFSVSGVRAYPRLKKETKSFGMLSSCPMEIR